MALQNEEDEQQPDEEQPSTNNLFGDKSAFDFGSSNLNREKDDGFYSSLLRKAGESNKPSPSTALSRFSDNVFKQYSEGGRQPEDAFESS